MNSSLTANYYIQTKAHWMKFLFSLLNNKKVNREVFPKYVDASKIPALKLKIQQEFENLLSQLPEPTIKQNNQFTRFMVITAVSLAFYRILKEEGFGLHQIGQIIFEIADMYYMTMNPLIKRIERWFYSLSTSQKKIKNKLEEYKKKTEAIPTDYRVDFIEGDGENLLWGLNYTECGGLKFLKQQNALEIAPYLCICDYPMFRAIKVGFNRTQNLAIGGTMCDFRFYKNYPTPTGWPLESLDEYKDFFAKKLKT
ncbi:MAG: L-2-amino-thiazoline-4-carboxylic acid hydrolase [Candidatus Hermodarchaeota archaeon]